MVVMADMCKSLLRAPASSQEMSVAPGRRAIVPGPERKRGQRFVPSKAQRRNADVAAAQYAVLHSWSWRGVCWGGWIQDDGRGVRLPHCRVRDSSCEARRVTAMRARVTAQPDSAVRSAMPASVPG